MDEKPSPHERMPAAGVPKVGSRRASRRTPADAFDVVLVVDEQALVRYAVRCLVLDSRLGREVREAGDAATALAAAALLPRRSAVVLDFGLAERNDYELARRVAEAAPSAPRLLSVDTRTRTATPAAVHAAFRAGMIAVVCKDEIPRELAPALRSAILGALYLGPTLGATLMSGLEQESVPANELSAHERDVLRLAALGHTSKEIGEEIGISPRTVETYRSRLARKLDLKSRSELVRYAIEHALLWGSWRG